MEVRQQTEKEALQRLQQEVESQRKESEEVQQRILQQEERLHLRSLAVESHLRILLAPREEEEQEEIYRELEHLRGERQEQEAWLQGELRRLQEQEKEQGLLVDRLGAELRDRREAAAQLLPPRGARREEEEHRSLTEIREVLLRAKEEEEPGGKSREAQDAQACYRRYKEAQIRELTELEEELRKQKEQLEEDDEEEEEVAARGQHVSMEEEEHLQHNLASRSRDRLRLLEEERHRALELLHSSSSSSSATEGNNSESGGAGLGAGLRAGLDKMLYAVEKELEEKEMQLRLLRHSEQELRQLQETYEFTANVARQEEKVRRKEKEILHNKEAQQKEAMVRAVSQLERRSCALRCSGAQDPREEEEEEAQINAYIEEEVQRRLRKLESSMEPSYDSLQVLQDVGVHERQRRDRKLKSKLEVSIPRYLLRGQGKDEHFEFEVKLSVVDETWTVFRRYRRFRELHCNLKTKYPELAALEFPPKKLFGNRDERMVAERRSHLE
ncbi:hypothetical protein CRUP_024776, partial [Coryphaenoides rupestris]